MFLARVFVLGLILALSNAIGYLVWGLAYMLYLWAAMPFPLGVATGTVAILALGWYILKFAWKRVATFITGKL